MSEIERTDSDMIEPHDQKPGTGHCSERLNITVKDDALCQFLASSYCVVPMSESYANAEVPESTRARRGHSYNSAGCQEQTGCRNCSSMNRMIDSNRELGHGESYCCLATIPPPPLAVPALASFVTDP